MSTLCDAIGQFVVPGVLLRDENQCAAAKATTEAFVTCKGIKTRTSRGEGGFWQTERCAVLLASNLRLTCLTTGLGAAPFLFVLASELLKCRCVQHVNEKVHPGRIGSGLAIANASTLEPFRDSVRLGLEFRLQQAVAAGMMLAASAGMLLEDCKHPAALNGLATERERLTSIVAIWIGKSLPDFWHSPYG